MKKIPVFVLLLLPALLLTASAGEEAAGHHINWIGVLGKIVNSTLLFGGLALMLRKPLMQMLTDKGAAVENGFREREKALAETAVRLEEIEQRLQKVTVEVEQIKASAAISGREELARLETAGREEAKRIIAVSEEEIRLRVDAAVRSVKSHIADLAIERFQEDFKKKLDSDMQQKIIERNISAIGDLDEGK